MDVVTLILLTFLITGGIVLAVLLLRVFHELQGVVNAADCIVTHDSGYPREQMVPFWKPVNPRGYIGWGKTRLQSARQRPARKWTRT